MQDARVFTPFGRLESPPDGQEAGMTQPLSPGTDGDQEQWKEGDMLGRDARSASRREKGPNSV